MAWRCDICKKDYKTKQEAEKCEKECRKKKQKIKNNNSAEDFVNQESTYYDNNSKKFFDNRVVQILTPIIIFLILVATTTSDTKDLLLILGLAVGFVMLFCGKNSSWIGAGFIAISLGNMTASEQDITGIYFSIGVALFLLIIFKFCEKLNECPYYGRYGYGRRSWR